MTIPAASRSHGASRLALIVGDTTRLAWELIGLKLQASSAGVQYHRLPDQDRIRMGLLRLKTQLIDCFVHLIPVQRILDTSAVRARYSDFMTILVKQAQGWRISRAYSKVLAPDEIIV
jgi:hypothetical protein